MLLSLHLRKPSINFKACIYVVHILELCTVRRKNVITELKLLEAI